jgi:hypothetical protein
MSNMTEDQQHRAAMKRRIFHINLAALVVILGLISANILLVPKEAQLLKSFLNLLPVLLGPAVMWRIRCLERQK